MGRKDLRDALEGLFSDIEDAADLATAAPYKPSTTHDLLPHEEVAIELEEGPSPTPISLAEDVGAFVPAWEPAPVADEAGKETAFPSLLRTAFSQLRIKITFPYALLAVVVALVAVYLVTRLLVGLLEDRFEAALLDAGHKVTDTLVQVENEQLAAWRAIAYTEGFAEAVAGGDGDTAASLASPHLINTQMDCLEVLDSTTGPLLAKHHQPGGEIEDYTSTPGEDYQDWEVVQSVLAGEEDEFGDKYASLVQTDWGSVFYTAGPIKHEGELVGVLLVGTYLDRLVERLDNVALARISVYVGGGLPLVTTLAPELATLEEDEKGLLTLEPHQYQAILDEQAEQAFRRPVRIWDREYAEVFGAFEARHGEDLGVFSVALPLSFVTDARRPTRETLLVFFGVATALIVVTGAAVASAVVQRIRRLATATQQVAEGNLSAQVDMKGYDEVASLAEDFNDMIVQLREGRLYRDLLGLTASPEVAERLREEVQKGQLQLQARSVAATVLFADIRDFTRLSERQHPAYIINVLNEYLRGLIRVIRGHDGVINKLYGDAALAFFGVLPQARPPEESAQQAWSAALGMMDYLEEWNRQRRERGEKPIRVGIGINTGPAVVGALGSEERLEYTIVGDVVNVTQRLSDLNKEYSQYDLFLSAETFRLLGKDARVNAAHLGKVHVKGRAAPVDVYAVGKGVAGGT